MSSTSTFHHSVSRDSKKKGQKLTRLEVPSCPRGSFFSSLEERAGCDLSWQLIQDPTNTYTSEQLDIALLSENLKTDTMVKLQGFPDFMSLKQLLVKPDLSLELVLAHCKKTKKIRPPSKSSGARLNTPNFNFEEEEREVPETRGRSCTEVPRFELDIDF